MTILLVQSPHAGTGHQITQSHINQIKTNFPETTVSLVREDSEEISIKLKSAEALLTFNLRPLTADAAPNLKLIQITSAGVNFLPEYIKDTDILLANSSGVHPIPIAEHILGFMIMLARQMHTAHRIQVTRKTWDRSVGELPINELSGRTVCIVGLGQIGQHAALLANSFGMKVIGVVRNPNRAEPHVAELVGVDQLKSKLSEADFVVNCLPGTGETNSLFDNSKFTAMKTTGFFINIGRGTTVVEKDLVVALQNNTIAGAGLDVFEHEPLPDESPLWQMENVIITPHYSGRTPYYMDRVIAIFIDNLKAFHEGKSLPTLVDKKLGY